jgi:hypothetical protein
MHKKRIYGLKRPFYRTVMRKDDMEKLIKLAKSLRTIFEERHKELDIPFFYNFPKNSCEGASMFFGHIAKVMCPEMNISIVKGFRVFEEDDEGYHFWVEINNRIFDLTSDQFDEAKEPIINENFEVKHIGFCIEDRQPVSDYLLYYIDNCLEIRRFASIREELFSALESYA